VKSSAGDGLVAKHRGFDQTPAIIARASLPAHASVLGNGRKMFVALRGCHFTCNGCNPWGNDHRCLRVTLGNSVIDDLAIVRPVCHHRGNVSTDLIKEVRHFGDVADITWRQFRRDDFSRASIESEMQFAPATARAHAEAVSAAMLSARWKLRVRSASGARHQDLPLRNAIPTRSLT
jgi:hypothetical protein